MRIGGILSAPEASCLALPQSISLALVLLRLTPPSPAVPVVTARTSGAEPPAPPSIPRDDGVLALAIAAAAPEIPRILQSFAEAELALVLTAIENSIDEFGATGIRSDVPFTANDYRSVYEDHLEALERFENETQPYKILDNILVRMHNVGRFHSGSQPLIVATTSALSLADIKAAIQDYKDDEETETDGEEGDDN
ncbi:hypothetical protein B0H14DRAFT_3423776 [Mycena olivaceomarginata]|nr:hypothetical protein B0H14DRAFT_3423776 [Mycena olivaceomarginata]